jgi:hypothetical protein
MTEFTADLLWTGLLLVAWFLSGVLLGLAL